MPATRPTPLPTREARAARGLLARLATRWQRPQLKATTVAIRPSLQRTLGRFSPKTNSIELSPRALSRRLFAQVLTHEAAHAALTHRQDTNSRPRPHGTEWKQLMAMAGFAGAQATSWRCRQATTSANRAPALYDHRCPVCQSSRPARRPVKAWRCASCAQAGLPGRLEITRRANSRTEQR